MEGLEPQVKIFSILSKLGNVVSKLVQLKHVTESPAAGQFFVIFWKKMAILMDSDHISQLFTAI